MRGFLAVGSLVLGLAVSLSPAQTRIFPQSFFWQPQEPGVPNDPHFVRATRVDITNFSPEGAAIDFGNQIIGGTPGLSPLNSTNVCLVIQEFGHDWNPVVPESAGFQQACTFTEEDRLLGLT